MTYPVVPLGPCCWGVTLATGTLAPAPPALELAPGSWMVRVQGRVWASTGARLTPDTSFMGPAGTANRVLGGPTAAGTVGTWQDTYSVTWSRSMFKGLVYIL